MFTTRVYRLSLACGVLWCAASSVFAQYGAKKQPVNLPPGNIRGEVKGFRSGALMVADPGTGAAYYVQVAPEAKKVDITGEADLSQLKAGMYIRFDIKMDKQGNGKEDLKKI